MATKAEVEKTAKHLWTRIAKGISKKLGMPDGDTAWDNLDELQRDGWRRVARWHLRKVAEAKAKAKGKIVYVYDDGTCE